MGLYTHAFPEVLASVFPDTRMAGSRVHVSPQCTSVAVSYSMAHFTEEDPGMNHTAESGSTVKQQFHPHE